MNMIDKMKNLFSKEELEQVKVVPAQLQTSSFSKNSFEDEDDLTPEQWSDHCFDMYAHEYHNLPPEERDDYIRSQDTYWMMQ